MSSTFFNNVSIKLSATVPLNGFPENYTVHFVNSVGKCYVSTCLSLTLSSGGNRPLGWFRFAKLMLNCSSLRWASIRCDREVVPCCANQLPLAWHHWELLPRYRTLNQNFLICRVHEGNRDWKELEWQKWKRALSSDRCTGEVNKGLREKPQT